MTTLTKEPDTGRVLTWFTQQDADATTVAISEWVVTEFASAIAKKVRTGALTLSESSIARSHFQLVFGPSRYLPISDVHFRNAARYVETPQLGLRAADALHLAICATAQATLCTLDKRMAVVGPKLGISTTLI